MKNEHLRELIGQAMSYHISGLPVAIQDEFSQRLGQIADDADEKVLKEFLGHVGYETWPYRMAYEQIYEKHYASEVHQCVRAQLSAEEVIRYDGFLEFAESAQVRLQQAYTEFVQHKNTFEQFLSSSEFKRFQELFLKCRESVIQKCDQGIRGEMKVEYENFLAEAMQERDSFLQGIKALEVLATEYPDQRAEIEDSIDVIRESMSVVASDIALDEIEKRIEYFQGMAGIDD